MERDNFFLLILLIVIVFGVLFSFYYLNNSSKNLTNFSIKGPASGVVSSTPYIVGSIIMFLVALFLIKIFFFPQVKLFGLVSGMSPTEAIETLFLEFQVAINRDDKQSATNIASKIEHLYEHLPDNDKKKYSEKIKDLNKFLG
jgi:hypothetical protein